MSIQEHLNKIRNAIKGSEVRESIAKGIETAYDDASENGNANMEVRLARGMNPNLNTRLNKMDETDRQNTEKIDSNYNEVTTQLAQTATKDYVEATNKRVDNLLIESGDANAEVTDAHVSLPKNTTFATLSSRIEAIENDTNFYIDNEMKNGDFSDGFSNWTADFANGKINDGIYINTGDGTNNIPRVTQTTDIPIENKKIYIKADIKPLSADCERLDIAIRAIGNGHNPVIETFSVHNPVSGTNYQLSNIFELRKGYEGATLQVEVRHVYSTPELASGKEAEIGNVVVIDLTHSFSEGNEPETSEIDSFLNKFNKRFFEGKVNYYDTLRLGNEIQKTNERVEKFGEPLPLSWDAAPLPSGIKSEYDYSKRMFIKRTNSISLDGTEAWDVFYKTGTNISRAKVVGYLDVINAKYPTSDFNIISNVPFKATTSISSTTEKDFYISFHESGDLYIGIPSDYLAANYTDNLQGITGFLKDNNVRITYETVQTEELPLPLGLSTTSEELIRVSSELDNISVATNERLSMLSYGNFGDVKYYNYEDLENRIKSYPEGYEVLGRDASDTYDIYGISVGNPNGKPILIHSGIHGNEWQGVSANLKFMELLASGALPDDNFLNDLLSNYYIYSIPCANPWGYAQTEVDNEWPNGLDGTVSRRNANGKNCNRDWSLEPAEPEQEIIKSKFKELRPVGFLNIHLKPTSLRPDNEAEFAVGGTGKSTLNNNIVASFKKLTGLKVGTLSNGLEGDQGRGWGAQQALQDGYEVLTMITELNSEGYFSHSEQMGLGLMQIHMFLKYCINYIENNSQESTF